MNIWDIIKTVGSAAIQVALPGTGSLIVGAVNELLPDDKKLPATATGAQVGQAIEGLPPEARASLQEKKFDVEILQIEQSHSTVRAMLESDARSPHTTRPYIARGAFHVVAFAVIILVSVWAYGVLQGDAAMVTAIMSGGPFVLTVLGPLVTLLWSYFGVLKKEHRTKLDAANGSPTPSGVAGLLSAIIKKR